MPRPSYSSQLHHWKAIADIKVTQHILRHSTLIMAVYKPKYLIWAVPKTAVAIGRDLTQFRSTQPPL
jgi:hypothetical protein